MIILISSDIFMYAISSIWESPTQLCMDYTINCWSYKQRGVSELGEQTFKVFFHTPAWSMFIWIWNSFSFLGTFRYNNILKQLHLLQTGKPWKSVFEFKSASYFLNRFFFFITILKAKARVNPQTITDFIEILGH